jgi:hypothetical protein
MFITAGAFARLMYRRNAAAAEAAGAAPGAALATGTASR